MPGMDFLASELNRFEGEGLKRELRMVRGPQGRIIELDGRRVVNFSSNNYLDLANHPSLCKAAAKAAMSDGVGSAASRLISGNHELHVLLEEKLAALHGTESALLFNSGYQANITTISALCGRDSVIFSDELNHASIIDGCRLARGQVVVYRHRDTSDLRNRLREHPAQKRLIVSDAVFSMDGDLAPLAELANIAEENDAMLMVDEAHALGVVGEAGLAEKLGVRPDITVATLGKSAGVFGAYVAGSRALQEFLINTARGFVFSTAPSVVNTAAALAAVELLRGGEGRTRRDLLRARMAQMGKVLDQLGLLAPGSGSSAIFPVHVGENTGAMECSARLLRDGHYVQGIRPPTVAPGSARLRIALMASHTPDDIDTLGDNLRTLQKERLL